MKTFALIQAFLNLVAPNDYILQDNIMQNIQANTDYTFYEYTTYMPSLEEVKQLEENAYGTGERTEKIKEFINSQEKYFFKSRIYDNSSQKIVGIIPFYGPYDDVIAYEYIIACGNNVCGSTYNVFPGMNDKEKALQKLNKDFKCKDEFYCDSYLRTMEKYAIKIFEVPDITPTSYRISKLGNYSGKIKFYHGIYGMDTKNNKVYSLDRDDKNLTKDEVVRRLKELVNTKDYSFTLNLLKEKARLRDSIIKPIPDIECDGCSFSDYTKEEIINNRKTDKPVEIKSYHKEKGYLDTTAILTGSYKNISRGDKEGDYLTGRTLMFRIFGIINVDHYELQL